MTDSLMETKEVKDLLMKVSGLGDSGGDLRLKRIVHRVVGDLFRTIEEFDVQPDEFWTAMSYLTRLGQANETGLLVPGLGLETFLDLRMDQAEKAAGIEGGTPRTIEGPLWVCAVQRRRFSVGAGPTRQFAPAGSSRSSHGGNEMAEAFGMRATNW
jgi:catechol 1,2-dioxygenase